MPWYDRPSGLAPLPHITLKREISRPLPAAAESRMRCSWTASACSGRSHVMLRPCRTPLLGYLSCPTGDLQDLLVYDPAAMAWTDLSASASGTPPSSRQSHGFTSAGGGLYVHGGLGDTGECRGGGALPGRTAACRPVSRTGRTGIPHLGQVCIGSAQNHRRSRPGFPELARCS